MQLRGLDRIGPPSSNGLTERDAHSIAYLSTRAGVRGAEDKHYLWPRFRHGNEIYQFIQILWRERPRIGERGACRTGSHLL